MSFNKIQYKKPFFNIRSELDQYLKEDSRSIDIPIQYEDLLRYSSLIPLENEGGQPTLWNAVIFHPSEMDDIYDKLVNVYRLLISDGSKVDHLTVDSVDFCSYGNSKPFRIKILNQLNDNFDYYYIKRADSSRVYGLELEHLLSPNKINYIYCKNTLIEEHIIGIPGDQFIQEMNDKKKVLNEVRLAKEFVKFNERCFVRLLGDMRAYNFVVVVTQDFDQVQYRIRAIDFDQQSFEGRSRIYLPQFYKDNVFYVKLTQDTMSYETAEQYQIEEQSLLRKRFIHAHDQINHLVDIMKNDTISFDDHIQKLKHDLTKYYSNDEFKGCSNMGELLMLNIKLRLGLD